MDEDQGIKSLEERIKNARSAKQSLGSNPDDQAEENGKAGPSPMGIAMKLGVELVVGVGVGLYLGYTIDKWLDTKPVAMIILILLGFLAGIKNVIRTAGKMNKDQQE